MRDLWRRSLSSVKSVMPFEVVLGIWIIFQFQNIRREILSAIKEDE